MTLLLSRGRVLSDDFRLLQLPTAEYTVHALYAWVPPSPRVRCLLACLLTYLLTGIRSRIPQMLDEMCESSISIQGGAHEKGTTKLALRC